MYVKEWPALTGRTFGDILFAFEAAVPIGVQRLVGPGNGGGSEGGSDGGDGPGVAPRAFNQATGPRGERFEMLLNPPATLVLRPGDQVIVIAEDDDAYAPLESFVPPGAGRPPPHDDGPRRAEKVQ